MVDLQFVGFALMPGPGRKEKQFGLPDYVCKIDVTLLSRMSHLASGFSVVFRETTTPSKKLLTCTSKIRERLDLFNTLMALKTCSGWTTVYSSIWKCEKLAVVVHVPKKAQNLVISRCCFAQDGKEMYKVPTHVHSYFCSLYNTDGPLFGDPQNVLHNENHEKFQHFRSQRKKSSLTSRCIVKGKISGGIKAFLAWYSLLKFRLLSTLLVLQKVVYLIRQNRI